MEAAHDLEKAFAGVGAGVCRFVGAGRQSRDSDRRHQWRHLHSISPFDPANAVPYQHWFYGFREAAFCHLSMVDDLRVDNLSYVLFLGRVSSGSLSARLCVHSGT
jgi:hypothetical protein